MRRSANVFCRQAVLSRADLATVVTGLSLAGELAAVAISAREGANGILGRWMEVFCGGSASPLVLFAVAQ